MTAGGIGRRQFLRAAGMTAAVGLLGRSGTPSKRPNILFIMGDDHTSQAWGCYGSRRSKFAHTRHIDRIAAEGALLRNCFCTNSICTPRRIA